MVPTVTPTRVTVNEPVDVWIAGVRNETDELWELYAVKASCGTSFVYPDDTLEDDPQEVGSYTFDEVNARIEADVNDIEWEDLTPAQRNAIIQMWTEEYA